MSVPTGMSDADEQEMIESLKRGTFAATVRRFVVHDLGISNWTEYLGRRYQVPFEIGVEKQFVLRAPAGTYSFQTITEMVPGIFGTRAEGCTMSNVAGFRIYERKTTYIGQLTIMAGFKSDEELKTERSTDNVRGVMTLGMPERFLNMNIRVPTSRKRHYGRSARMERVQRPDWIPT